MEICKHLKKNYESFVDFSKNTFNSMEDWKSFCESKYMNKPISDHFPLRITDSNITQINNENINYMAKSIMVEFHRKQNDFQFVKLLNNTCVWQNLQSVDFSKSGVCITDDIVFSIYKSMSNFELFFFFNFKAFDVYIFKKINIEKTRPLVK